MSEPLRNAAARIVAFLAMLEACAVLGGNPLKDDERMLSFSGCGASDVLRVRDFRALRDALIASEADGVL